MAVNLPGRTIAYLDSVRAVRTPGIVRRTQGADKHLPMYSMNSEHPDRQQECDKYDDFLNPTHDPSR